MTMNSQGYTGLQVEPGAFGSSQNTCRLETGSSPPCGITQLSLQAVTDVNLEEMKVEPRKKHTQEKQEERLETFG